ncbi:Protein phytochrome kinase substrate 1 [Apostasia shenzhenica]|uniref:Protein phytochrome kinase substrate 1 n=1 Tax=Apostasia shenzhenica TaxID=1088818 RepID=A0A2I0BCS4_9ASPA|nr:Protein phytochrome kinase substrate 1 [Apostasia shenzhenica]
MREMERYRISPNFNGVLPRRTNYFTTAPSQISLLPPKPHLRDPPILPYLQPQPPAAPGDHQGHIPDDSEISIFDAERYFNEGREPTEASKKLVVALDSVAERCDHSLNSTPSSVFSGDGYLRNSHNRSFHATPTVSSEASWNSQVGLLRNRPGSLSVSVRSFPVAGEQRKRRISGGRRLFRRGCLCSGKKSIDVEEKYSDPKTPVRCSFDCYSSPSAKIQSLKEEVEQVAKVKVFPGIWSKDTELFRASGRFSPEIGRRIVNSGGFSFPILAPLKNDAAEEPARDSLEVFRPSDGTTSPDIRKSADFQKKPVSLLQFSKDGGDRRSFTFPGSPKTRTVMDDDLASDTSSDLFEIESLSTQVTYRRRDSVDELSASAFDPKRLSGSATTTAGIFQLRRSMEEEEAAPSIAPIECYPPSEVSVEWSVTTAEGFDRPSVANFSSAVSEYDELRYAAEVEAAGGGKKKGFGGSGGGGILSCRSEKAVSVIGPNLVRFGPLAQRRTGVSRAAVEPVRAVGLAKSGAVNPVQDIAGLTRPKSGLMVSRPAQKAGSGNCQ